MLACALLSATLLAACKQAPEHRHFITDAEGRALVLHGINVSSAAKGAPGRQPPGFGPEEARRMGVDWGLNLVRLLVFWDAVEPAPGQFDDGYLDAVAERVRWFHENGVHVVLDMHQDIYSLQFGGDGAPPWAVRDDGLPVVGQSPWWLTAAQPGVLAAVWHFWHDDDLKEHYIRSVRQVAARFAETPGVLGIDLMNEPYAGLDTLFDYFGWERRMLTPFYQQAIDEVRDVAPNLWVFVEPQSFGVNAGLPSSLGQLTDPRQGEPRLAYFPHLYPIDLELGGAYKGDGMILPWVSTRSEEVDRSQMPLLIGEVGFWGEGQGAFMRDVLAMSDRVGSGWAWWAWDDIGPLRPDGSEHPEAGRLVRAYPRAVAGYPLDYGWDPVGRTFWLDFETDPGVTAPTEVFVPRRHFPSGFEVDVDAAPENWHVEWDSGRQVLSLTTDPSVGRYRLRVTPSAPS